MASNPGAWVLMGGAALLATSPIWVPAAGKVAEAGANFCRSKPQACQASGVGLAGGILKGGFNMETGLPPDSATGFVSGKAGEIIAGELKEVIQDSSQNIVQAPCIEESR